MKRVALALLLLATPCQALTNDEVNELIQLDLADTPSPCGPKFSVSECREVIDAFVKQAEPGDDFVDWLDDLVAQLAWPTKL